MRGPVLSALLAAPIAAVLLLAGCGSDAGGGPDVASVSGTGAPTAAGAQPSGDPHEKALKFAQCMRENGIDMEDPEPGKGVLLKLDKNGSKETMDKAQEACKQYAPSGKLAGGGDPKMAENLRKVAQCMRDNGVEGYPDPEGGGVRITAEIGEDPDFKAAQEKCQKEMAEAGMGGF
ncbi:hypothetical protein [Nonomuraea sp. NPDC002799]